MPLQYENGVAGFGDVVPDLVNLGRSTVHCYIGEKVCEPHEIFTGYCYIFILTKRKDT